MNIRFSLVSLLLLVLAGTLYAQSIRVMTYNVLQFGEEEEDARIAALRTVIDAAEPDIICAQEIQGPSGYFAFHSKITGPGGYMSAGFIDGPDDNDDELFYRESKVTMLGMQEIEIEPRPAHVYTVHALGTSDTIHIVVVHLQAGASEADVATRTEACRQIRRVLDTLPLHHHRIVAGDLNMFSSSEEGYQILTIVGIAEAGEVADPINRPGRWSNDSTFADLHTHSTRADSLDDGGGNGGMVNRFDQILVSPRLLPYLVQESYEAIGQDGEHFGRSLLDGLNGVVSQELAQALYTASDHLPVVVSLELATSGVEELRGRGKVMDLTQR